MATTVAPVTTGRLTSAVEPPKFKPIKLWAFLGCVWLGIYAYSTTRWLLGGHAHRTGTGPDEVPTYMKIGAHIHNVGMPALAVVAIYFFIIKPWKQERRLTANGLVVLAGLTLWFQDPLPNYFRPIFVFNSYAPQLGCPQCFLPGWQSRSASFAEPAIWGQAFYFGGLVLIVAGGARLMARFRRRWPQYGRIGPFLMILTVGVIGDFAIEGSWLRLGLYVYPSSYGPLTFFGGHYYQFPAYACFFGGLWYAVLCAARYYVNDKGEMLCERGVDELRGPKNYRPILRILGAIGLFNSVLFVAFDAPMAVVGAVSNYAWPEDIYSRSYYTQDICGEGTTYACMDPRVPIPAGPRSAHISPDGKLVVPAGLPDQTK